MAASSPAGAGYRLLGAIIAGPGGNLFVKFTGPAKTIAANQQKFEQILTSLQPFLHKKSPDRESPSKHTEITPSFKSRAGNVIAPR